MPSFPDIVPVGQWGVFPSPAPWMIAGPCSAESPQQVLDTARALARQGVGVFRAGLWKPRTHPRSFEGVGTEGLPWLLQVREETGMKVCTEVALAAHVHACLEAGVDMVWIGARTTASPFLVQEIADALRGSDIPVLVKNPLNPDLDLWAGALERLYLAGVRKLGAVHRGFSAIPHAPYRNLPLWEMAVDLKTRFPALPVLVDPSHMAGDRKYIPELAQQALDLGLEGLMVECHCHPEEAFSDAAQQLTPEAFGQLISTLRIRRQDSIDLSYREGVSRLRARIDALDADLVRALAARMAVSREIGQYKKEHNVSILQPSRWEAVLERARREGAELGLSDEFITAAFTAVHEESVRIQNEILSDGKE